MSIVSQDHSQRIELPRRDRKEFWNLVRQHYAKDDPKRWRALAMLALHETAGWSNNEIGFVFDMARGHVHRTLHKMVHELRHTFEPQAEDSYVEDLLPTIQDLEEDRPAILPEHPVACGLRS